MTVLVHVMTRHAYLPTLILSEQGSQFQSETVAEITEILGTQVKHASTKHAQKVAILERTHVSNLIIVSVSLDVLG